MDDLESYVSGSLREDEAIIRELEESISTTLDLFSTIEFEAEPRAGNDSSSIATLWPYWVLDADRTNFRDLKSSEARPTDRLSQSTTGMIVAALDVATSNPRNRSSSGYRWDGQTASQPEKRSAVLQTRLEIAVAKMAEQKKDSTW